MRMSMSLLKGSALLLVTTSVDLTLRRLTFRKFSLLASPARATSARLVLECFATFEGRGERNVNFPLEIKRHAA